MQFVWFILCILLVPIRSFAEDLTISCGSNGVELELCQQAANEWSKKSKHNVHVITTPNDSNERLALYQQLLGAKSADIDIFQIDVIWPGILSNHFLDLKPYFNTQELTKFFNFAIQNNEVDGRLVAMPWFMDAGVLFYRKDLLEKYHEKVPQTWQELERIAKKIQNEENKNANQELWGYVFQGRAYEGLTCNALEWISSFGGGEVLTDSGGVSIFNPNAIKSLNFFSEWIGQITPKGVLNYSEEEARGVFQSQKAVFMRNWPYAWALANAGDSPLRGKVGMAPLPSGNEGKHSATLGGWGLAVSKYTAHPALAVDFLKFLTSIEEQKRRALIGGFNPTYPMLYNDDILIKANPHTKFLKEAFFSAVPRPSRFAKRKYIRISYEFWNAVHQVLSKNSSAEDEFKKLDKKLKRVLSR